MKQRMSNVCLQITTRVATTGCTFPWVSSTVTCTTSTWSVCLHHSQLWEAERQTCDMNIFRRCSCWRVRAGNCGSIWIVCEWPSFLVTSSNTSSSIFSAATAWTTRGRTTRLWRNTAQVTSLMITLLAGWKHPARRQRSVFGAGSERTQCGIARMWRHQQRETNVELEPRLNNYTVVLGKSQLFSL